jgi:hypothetical protein
MVLGTSKELFNLAIEDWARLVQIAAIIIGAMAAYIKWFRGRLYQTRLEVSVSGSLVEASSSQLLVTTRAKNVGLSKVSIKQEGSGLRIFSPSGTEQVLHMLSTNWNHEATFPVFQEHGWIESSETIESQLLVRLPESQSGIYRLELVLASGKVVWKATSIATAEKSKNNSLKEA